jgi:hypothetical protein
MSIDNLAIGKSLTRKVSMNEKTKPAKRSTTTKTASNSTTAKKAASAVATTAVNTKARKVAAKSSVAPAPKPGPAPAAKALPRKAVDLPKPVLDEGQRAQYVSVAAYYIAERRGFNGSYEIADWTQAETEIDNLLREGKLSS